MNRLIPLTALLIGATGCDEITPEDGGHAVTEPASVSCTVYTRLSPYNGGSSDFSEVSITATPSDDWVEVTAEDFLFQLRYAETDDFNSGFVKVYIWPVDSEQMPYDALNEVLHTPPEAGTAGFTGLQYVYHPISASELQYTCDAG